MSSRKVKATEEHKDKMAMKAQIRSIRCDQIQKLRADAEAKGEPLGLNVAFVGPESSRHS